MYSLSATRYPVLQRLGYLFFLRDFPRHSFQWAIPDEIPIKDRKSCKNKKFYNRNGRILSRNYNWIDAKKFYQQTHLALCDTEVENMN